ncbi:MAG: cation diffusion facilitator family transporter [Tepidisphaeraceae bacterium]
MFLFWTRIPRNERAAIGLSIVVGIVLLGLKFAAYWITESSAVFSDAVESIVNVIASLVAFWALSLAHTPPDEKHPYGHGKAEFMAAAFEGGMILLAGVFILIRTVDEVFFQHMEPQQLGLGLVLMAIAFGVNGIVGLILVRLGKRQDSMTLEADGHHLLTDAVTSLGVIVSLAIVHLTGWVWADPLAAFIIAIYIATTGLAVAKRSFGGLMDQQDVDDEKNLIALLDSHVGPSGKEPRICSYHKLRHRHSGRYHWVDFHIVVPAHLTIDDGHRIASAIEYEIECMMGEGNATAHIEPCEDAHCERCGADRQAAALRA